jgi:hypothetical protein
MTSHTYSKRLGLLNVEREEPIVEADGQAWCTSREDPNLIVVVHDGMEGVANVAPLPAGVSAITMDGERLTT